MTGEEIPIETFDGLLRSLVTWGLIVPGQGDEAETWHLTMRAQQRLGALRIPAAPWPTELTAYLGRRCADCGRRQLTWVREGSYLCDPCWRHRLAAENDPTSTDPTMSGRSRRLPNDGQRIA